jgi:hypothetical protein
MKKLAKTLLLILSIGLMTGAYSCSEDETPALDPNVFCDENLCSTDSDLKKQCVDAFNDCIANNPDANDDECAATALIICRI